MKIRFVFVIASFRVCRPGGDDAVAGNVAAVGRGFGQHDVRGAERDLGDPEHGHRRLVDRGGEEERRQVVGVPAGADGHAAGQHGGRPRDPTAHGGQPRGDRPAVFPAGTALAAAARARDIGRRTAAAQVRDRVVQVSELCVLVVL